MLVGEGLGITQINHVVVVTTHTVVIIFALKQLVQVVDSRNYERLFIGLVFLALLRLHPSRALFITN